MKYASRFKSLVLGICIKYILNESSLSLKTFSGLQCDFSSNVFYDI